MRALVTAIVGSLAFATCTPVAAQPAPGAVSPGDAEALEHLDRGVAAYRAGQLAIARDELDTARKLVPDRPNPYRWLALTDAALGNCSTALFDIESFLSRVPAGDERVKEMVQLRERCILEVKATQPAPGVTTINHDDTPITHRWWLWTAIGAVALAAVGVTTYALVHDNGPAMLPGISCGPSGCTR